jgi:hypothetical protein
VAGGDGQGVGAVTIAEVIEAAEVQVESNRPAAAPQADPTRPPLLGGRFRLDERVSMAAGFPQWTPGGRVAVRTLADGLVVWKATDELLRRPVTLHLLPRGLPVPPHVVEAVRAAARVSDPRLATIYDTECSPEWPYIVSEWTGGTHLEDLVLSGLPSPALAAAMIADAAEAVAVAHRAGRPHLCLGTRSLRWATGSGLKITGLGIDAALCGASAADPAAIDTVALARMLYALLTGFWPGDEPTALPPAPRRKGRAYSPRQVRAGVPRVLDAITGYALGIGAHAGQQAVLTPAGLAAALCSVQRPWYASFQSAGCDPDTAPGRHARHAKAKAIRVRGAVRRRATLLRPAA